MPVISYPFSNAANYQYSSDIAVSAGATELSLVDNTNQTFVQDFSNDTGFTYNSSLTEFNAGTIRQIDQTGSALCGASFGSTINLESWAPGTVTGVATGNSQITNNRLDLTPDGVDYVRFTGSSNFGVGNTGCVRVKFTPNWSGTPSSHKIFLHIGVGTSNVNNITLLQSSTGQGSLTITDSTGAPIVTVALGLFVPVAGTTYEVEVNWDVTAGETRAFVNGVQFGTTQTDTGSRTNTADTMLIGTDRTLSYTSNSYVEDVAIYDTVQHTANYTPGYTVPTKRYSADTVYLPQESYTGLGTVQGFTNFVSTGSTDTPRYTLNSLYYNGTDWVASAGTYDTANIEADTAANITSLPSSDTLNIVLYFTNSDVQGSLTALTTTYTGQLYAQNNPTIMPTSTFGADGISIFTSTVTAGGTDAVTFVVDVDGTYMYWSGAAWATSTGYSQSNTSSDINTNIGTLLSSGSIIRPVAYLHSADGSSTPNLDNISITYDFYAAPPQLPETIIVYGRILDIDTTPVGGCTIECSVDQNGDLTTNHWASKYTVQTTSNANGDWELEVLRSSAFEIENTTFTFAITRLDETKKYKKYGITLPDSVPSIAYNTL